jgi:hypothetical protein
MKAGKATETNNRGSTNEQLGKRIGVSDATIKKAKAVQNHAPDKLKDVAQGRTTANEVLNEVKATKKQESASKPKAEVSQPKPLASVKIGDKVFVVRPYEWGDGDIYVEDRIVKNIVNGQLHFEGNQTKDKTAVYSREESEKQRKVKLADAIKTMVEELAELRKKLNPPPKKPSVQKTKAKAVKTQATPKENVLKEPAPSPEMKVV